MRIRLHAAHGRHPFVSLPYRPGHEVVGVIETTGSAAGRWTQGQRVIVEPDLPCWAKRNGRPKLTVGVSPGGNGPLAGQTDVTVPDPHGVISLLRQIIEDVT